MEIIFIIIALTAGVGGGFGIAKFLEKKFEQRPQDKQPLDDKRQKL